MGPPPGSAVPSRGPLLQVRALACDRGGRQLFGGLELQVSPGEIVWLRGTNGRGKTSLLRLLCGLSTPAGGEIELRASPTPSEAAGICWVAHANALKDDLKAGEALGFLCALAGIRPTVAELGRALDRMGVLSHEHALVRTLSQGQRRRVALARLAMSLRTPLWLLDEPFDALDDRGVQALKSLLGEHASTGGATVLTSHQDVGLGQLASAGAMVLREFSLDASPGDNVPAHAADRMQT